MDTDNSDQRTVWCGNLSEKITDDLLFELFLQAGPIQKVSIPKDREGRPIGYGFVTFKHEVSVKYAIQLLDGTSLFDKRINLKPRTRQEPKRENVNVVPVPAVMYNSMNDISTLMQMGAHMLNFANNQHSYSNEKSNRNQSWDRSRNNHREDRKRDDKPYRNHRGNNNYYGNRQQNRAAHGSEYERNNRRHRHH